MAAMTPLVSSAGPEFVASLRLLPAGILVLITTYLFKRDLKIYKCDLKWFFVFTIVDATFFQLFLTYGIEKTGAGLGSVLIDSQPLLVAILARAIFGNLINPIGWLGLLFGLGGIIFLGVPQEVLGNLWLMSDTGMTDVSFNFGELWMLAASLAMALGTILIRFTCTKSDPVAVTGWHMVVGSLPLIIKGILPKTMCHPVTATGSLLVQVNLIKIVPRAIASEAASIQSSPKLNTTSVIAVSDINHPFTRNS